MELTIPNSVLSASKSLGSAVHTTRRVRGVASKLYLHRQRLRPLEAVQVYSI